MKIKKQWRYKLHQIVMLNKNQLDSGARLKIMIGEYINAAEI